MKHFVILLWCCWGVLSLTGHLSAQTAAEPVVTQLADDSVSVQIRWMDLDAALQSMETEPRKLLIYVHTDWCDWCKRMDEDVFQLPNIAQALNRDFYAVRLDAEHDGKIVFKGKEYKFNKSGARGYHTLAAELLNGRLSFPTSVFLDEALEVIQPLNGYKDANEFQLILSYFAGDHHLKTPWSQYQEMARPVQYPILQQTVQPALEKAEVKN